ncbi:unnamed protein product [Penicillium nalgiovense]|nr:unnamed protein product [Penicillium nalgiovense]
MLCNMRLGRLQACAIKGISYLFLSILPYCKDTMKPLSPTSWAAQSMTGLLMFPLLPVEASTGNPSLAPAPPMGFNNWARFECGLNETLFTETARAMRKRGLPDVGYDRLTLDDCWMLYDRVPHAPRPLDSHVAKVYRIALPGSYTKTTPTGMVFNTPSSFCMTASTDSITFEKCNASDSQVWHVTATGDGTKLTLSPLSDTSVCLAAGDGVSLAQCQGGIDTAWDHYISGHLRSSSGNCLTQTKDKASIEECVIDSVGQIFGLPSGFHLVKGVLD